jgi:hypothetical protein
MKYEALGAVFEKHGFEVVNSYGTFASIRDYQYYLDKEPQLAQLFIKLREYYDTNFLSCIFAPLFPAQSRNALWELRKCKEGKAHTNKFPKIEDIKQPWGSSQQWKDMSL